MNRKFYSTAEVAKILHLSRVEVFRKIKSKRLRAEKIGRNYVIAHEDLLEALGQAVGSSRKQKIETAVKKAVKEYGGAFRRLAKE
ncbi:MAG: helix-turn-helix domain-containing protein [Candidatus Campbellbacteria bacterium]|nr:helix-turn-helix domain-containing protein [Candidatus Campbellbacteria bacterium]